MNFDLPELTPEAPQGALCQVKVSKLRPTQNAVGFDEVNDKIDLLKGVLQWNLEREFRDRLISLRRAQQETGEALVATQRSWRQIEETMRNEPERYAALSERVEGLAPRIEGMKMRVGDALARQRAFLQEIAIGELRAQRERLDVYTIQARFALAAIYDISSSAQEAAE